MSNKKYNSNIEKWKQAYQEILDACEKYQDFDIQYGFRDIKEMCNKAKGHLACIEWYERYGTILDHNVAEPTTTDYFRINCYLYFQKFKDAQECKASGGGRYISRSDDGRQPEDGWHLTISFSTGAYIFGDDHEDQKRLFQDFFDELKTYKPDYSDSTNNALYWRVENAKEILGKFRGVLRKYQEKNKAEFKERKARKLREELEKVEVELTKEKEDE